MKWLFNVETINQQYTSGLKFFIFTFLTITFMENHYQGEHLSVGLGIVPLEISIQLSIWKATS